MQDSFKLCHFKTCHPRASIAHRARGVWGTEGFRLQPVADYPEVPLSSELGCSDLLYDLVCCCGSMVIASPNAFSHLGPSGVCFSLLKKEKPKKARCLIKGITDWGFGSLFFFYNCSLLADRALTCFKNNKGYCWYPLLFCEKGRYFQSSGRTLYTPDII